MWRESDRRRSLSSWLQRSSCWLGLVAGCYSPERVGCRIRCDDSGRCPWDMTCSSGLCAAAGTNCSSQTVPSPADVGARKESRCSLGTRRCASPSRIERCEEDGSWLPAANCEGGSACVLGDCRVCAEGVLRCADEEHVQRCGPDGWSAPEVCASDRVCRLSSCVPTRQISAGAAHACSLDRNGAVHCWGDGSYAALGLGDRENRGDSPDRPAGRVALEPALAVVAGGSHTCAVLRDRRLRCWGDNSAGQLGLGDTALRGDTPGQIELLEPVELAAGEEVADVALGLRHTCVLLARGAVKCWGDNSSGQLGLGDTDARGDQPGEIEVLPDVDLGATAVSVAAGGSSTCAVLADGRAICWGQTLLGATGESAIGDQPGEVRAYAPLTGIGGFSRVSMGMVSACGFREHGVLSCWGQSRGGQLGRASDGGSPESLEFDMARVLSVASVGAAHACAVLNGEATCWGVNAFGALGLGNADLQRGATHPEDGEAWELREWKPVNLGTNVRVVDLSAGDQFTCAVLADERVKCWGANLRGQLGLGDTASRGETPEQLGENLRAVPLDD